MDDKKELIELNRQMAKARQICKDYFMDNYCGDSIEEAERQFQEFWIKWMK